MKLVLVALILTGSTLAWAKEAPKASYHVTRKISLPGPVSYYDFLTFDEGSRRLYVSHGEDVVVVDPEAGSVVAKLPGFKKVHGIALAGGRAFVTDGGADKVRAFDLKTWQPAGEVATGKNPDPIMYDPASKQIISFNHSGGSVTFIDPATVKATGTIEFGGKVEVGRGDGKGTVFANIEDKNEIVRIDTRKKAVTAHWSIAPCQTPTGLAFDAKNRRLFAGCEDNKLLVVVDADSGKVLTSAPIGERVDGVEYDPQAGLVFASCAGGTLTVIRQESPDKYSVLQNVETAKGAKTLAYDASKHRVFVPAKAASGSLEVLVVEP